MSGPPAAVAAVRSAVRRCLADLVVPQPAAPADPPGPVAPEPNEGRRSLVLVACSGGADSRALALALSFVAPRLGLRGGALVVDHGLQEGSGPRSGALAVQLRTDGLEPVEVLTVAVDPTFAGGPEAAARAARYGALEAAATRLGAVAVLVGHTRDDQAETVLLGLARGSGIRSLAGMADRRGLLRRPLLDLDRTVTAAACAAAGVAVWTDPHNSDARFSRARVRSRVLPVLEAELGPGVAAALARTAALARADADALDTLADALAERAAADGPGPDGEGPDTAARGWDCAVLATAPPALRGRVLRRAAIASGCPATDLSAQHVAGLHSLVTDWHGQGPLELPGRVRATRREGRLLLTRG